MNLKTKALIALWLVGWLLLVWPPLALVTAALITVLVLFGPKRRALPAPQARVTKLLSHVVTE